MEAATTPGARLLETADYVVPFAIRVVGDVGIADAFAAGPRPVADVAAQLAVDPDALERLLALLCEVGVFRAVEPGVVALAPMGEFMRGDHPNSLQGTFPLMVDDVRAWAHTTDSIRTGRTGFSMVHGADYYDYFVDKPDECARFDRSVQTLHVLMVRTLLGAFDWGSLGHVVDVGSGNGAFTAELLARHPGLTATLVDLPHVIHRAQAELDGAGVAERAELVAGDFFETLPAGADAYLLKTILHDWDTPRARRIIEVVAAAMSPHSRLLALEAVPLPGNDYDLGKIMDIKQLVLFGGHARSREEFEDLFGSAGLTVTGITRTPTLVVIEARAADGAAPRATGATA